MESKTSFLATIVNYGFSQQADELKRLFSSHFPTLLIDNSSQPSPRTADVILPNHYYVGLWNEAVRQALDRGTTWLILCASDVAIDDIEAFSRCFREASEDQSIGLYTPSLRTDSRTSFGDCYHRGTGGMRQCHVVEGFFFACRVSILKSFYPVDPVKHRYGWGIDVFTAFQALRLGYATVVDDRTVIYHPQSVHEIDEETAFEQSKVICPDPDYQAFRERIWRAQLLFENRDVRNQLQISEARSRQLSVRVEPLQGTPRFSRFGSRFVKRFGQLRDAFGVMFSRSAKDQPHH